MKPLKKSWKNALGAKEEELQKVEKVYTHEDFVDVLDYITAKYKITPQKVSDNTALIVFYPEVEFARLIYDPEHTRIVITFHVQTSISDAISFFCNLRTLWEDLALMISYYVDYEGNLNLGNEAEVALYSDLEEIIIENFMSSVEDPVVDKYLQLKNQNRTFISTDKYKAMDYFLRMIKQNGTIH
jgi:hypothetical protein